ncbi:hypothetical protein ACIO6U_02445 [Streptomyces sp. NPDC087422]|uniref:hypothetical protein n=1 Tax=Streptomyces sp. NPDC087422 TaxID=3365786 RepID=UPI003808522D
MPCPSCVPAPLRPDAAVLNARIRRLSEGRTVWAAEDLVKLARLQAEWRAAVEAEERAGGTVVGPES